MDRESLGEAFPRPPVGTLNAKIACHIKGPISERRDIRVQDGSQPLAQYDGEIPTKSEFKPSADLRISVPAGKMLSWELLRH